MSGLLSEYRRRHGLSAVCPTNEGFLFVANGNERMIVLTSTSSKSLSVGECCSFNPGSIILEIYDVVGRQSNCMDRRAHTHIPPDGDVLAYIKTLHPNGEAFVPFLAKTTRQLEGWLWNAFIDVCDPFTSLGPVGSIYKEDFMRNGRKTGNEQDWIDETIWLLTRQPQMLLDYYTHLYNNCMFGRQYLLMD